MSIDSIVSGGLSATSLGAAAPTRTYEKSASGAEPAALAGARPPASPIDSEAPVKASGAAPSLEQVNDAVASLNKSVQAKSQGLEFSIDNDSKRTIVKVVDQSTKEVLRQMPTQEALEIAKSLDQSKGFLIKQTA